MITIWNTRLSFANCTLHPCVSTFVKGMCVCVCVVYVCLVIVEWNGSSLTASWYASKENGEFHLKMQRTQTTTCQWKHYMKKKTMRIRWNKFNRNRSEAEAKNFFSWLDSIFCGVSHGQTNWNAAKIRWFCSMCMYFGALEDTPNYLGFSPHVFLYIVYQSTSS